MNRTLTTCVLLLSTVPGIAIAAAPVAQISALAAATGLSERQVKMVVGGHTAYSEYRTSYDWARRRFVQVLGVRRYNELMAGGEIALDNGQRVAMLDR